MTTYTVYLPFVQHATTPQKWQLDATLRQVDGDTLDISAVPTSDGAIAEVAFLTSATVRLTNKLSLMMAIVEDT